MACCCCGVVGENGIRVVMVMVVVEIKTKLGNDDGVVGSEGAAADGIATNAGEHGGGDENNGGVVM